MNPAELKWHPFPLPKPEAVHPDSRIVAWRTTYDGAELSFLRSDGKDWRLVADTRQGRPGDWFCYDLQREHHWAWTTSFHRPGED